MFFNDENRKKKPYQNGTDSYKKVMWPCQVTMATKSLIKHKGSEKEAKVR